MTGPAVIAAVSVVIPCYRCAATIRRAVDSVTRQTRRPAELILVDDASGDDTLDVLLAIQAELGADWVKVIRRPENRGAAEARNAGWEAATQPYIAFLDADDAWHPRKVEIQVSFMERHPEFGVTGHAHEQLRRGSEWRLPDPADGYDRITFRQLLASNRFITPSAMVRRDVPSRFPADGRHMEDFGLWLDLASRGIEIARLNATLAVIFKAPYGEGGLSANLVAMERAELGVYARLHSAGRLPLALLIGLVILSLAKFAKRLVVNVFRPGSQSMPWVFPAAYLTVSHSTTALLVLASLLGQQELGAEIGIVGGATIATFYAFSANTRMLILGRSETLPVPMILAWRLVLLAPLSLGAGWLSAQTPEVGFPLIVALVLRRAVEWLNEIHLSVAEVRGDWKLAFWFLAGQSALLTAVVILLAIDSVAFVPGLFLWATLPLAYTLPFLRRNLVHWSFPSRPAVLQLAGHSGSTAVSGLSLYAFRVLLLLILGKAAAGDTFAAIAIGSFMGTLVANVVGPSVELHRERLGGSTLPGLVRVAVFSATAAGVVIAAAAGGLAETALGLGKSSFFWRAVGLSLIGGGLMVVAQFVRLRIIRHDDAREVLGPDVLVHMSLLACVPLLAITSGPSGMAMIYLLNAALAFGFYKSAELLRANDASTVVAMRDRVVRSVLPFLLFVPVFFQLAGGIYDTQSPLPDSGGVLRSLPLPLSVLACPLALLAIGRYARAALGYGFLFLAFALLALSTIVSAQGHFETATGKLLLLGQCVLPILALPCGLQFAEIDRDGTALARGAAAVLAVIVPAQLLATWIDGETLLSHRVFIFSVWQHLQFVPVILVLGFCVALNILWPRLRHRLGLALLGPCVGIYAIAALANLAIAATLIAVVLFLILHRPSGHRLSYVIVVLGTPIAMAGYVIPVSNNPAFIQKFPMLTNLAHYGAPRCGDSPVTIAPFWLTYESLQVTLTKNGCEIHGDVTGRGNWTLLTPRPYEGTARHALLVTGELREGGLRVGVLHYVRPGGWQWKNYREIREQGPFRIEMATGDGWVHGAVGYDMPPGQRALDAEISVLEIIRAQSRIAPPSALETRPDDSHEPASTSATDAIPENLTERFADWRLFGKEVFASPTAFLFGHPRPIDRSVRSSAHNYYIDIAFNFGVVGLVPVLGLLLWTFRRAIRLRGHLLRDPVLTSLMAAVLFLVLLDSSFKVTLRQPYPGLVAFFLWGVLLSHLRQLTSSPQLRR